MFDHLESNHPKLNTKIDQRSSAISRVHYQKLMKKINEVNLDSGRAREWACPSVRCSSVKPGVLMATLSLGSDSSDSRFPALVVMVIPSLV